MKTTSKLSLLFLLLFGLAGCGCFSSVPEERFQGDRAFNHAEQQMSHGPRTPGSMGHELTRSYIQETLMDHGWDVEVQQGEYQGSPVFNIVASQNTPGISESNQYIILGAHYDTRITADKSPLVEDQMMPVPGANDGASGVAVLLELSRVLPEFDHLHVQLVFFDAEDNGSIPGWDWIVGSELFAESMVILPDAVVIVDMIGDADQQIYWEKSSDPFLRREIWSVAAGLGYDSFIPEVKYHILDDHTPFLQRGVPAVDLIDFDYPYWHTTEDTIEKISPDSLEAVGVVLMEWLALRDISGK